MQKTTRHERMMRAAGFAAGVAVIALALLAWRLPAIRTDLGAEAAFSATPTGELEVRPLGVFLDAKRLVPGGASPSGRLAVRNQTGRTLVVSLHALPAARDLDDRLSVELVSGTTTVFRGTLGGLRDWTAPIRLRSGEQAPLHLRVSIPASVTSGYSARIVSIPLELRSARAA